MDPPPVYIGEDGNVYATPETVAYARREAINIPKGLKDKHFKNFTTTHTDQHYFHAGAIGWCKDLAEGKRQRIGLFISGPTGCGKTHIAVACLKKLCNHFAPYFTDFRELVEDCRSNRWDFDPVAEYRHRELLLIDEFACEPVSDSVISRITAIISLRMSDVRPTIITSNASYPEEFIGRRIRGGGCNFPLDERLQSRIEYQFHMIQAKGAPDYRKLTG